jgi:hypothetical protein
MVRSAGERQVERTGRSLSAEPHLFQRWQLGIRGRNRVVEHRQALIRTTKAILETRPIYYNRDDTIWGHVFRSFLALLLKKALEERLRERDNPWEWADMLRGLNQPKKSSSLARCASELFWFCPFPALRGE